MSAVRQHIAVTLGDPGGIGPEVIARALSPAVRRGRWGGLGFVVHGSASALQAACEVIGVEPYWAQVERGSPLVAAALVHDVVLVDADAALARGGDGGAPAFERRATRLGGMLSYAWVEDAIASVGWSEGAPAAIVTGPISKTAWNLAGQKRFPGHTEMFAARLGAKRFVMMFEGPRLRVSLATVHIPLMDVRDVLTIGRVYDAIDLGIEGCKRLGVARPRAAVCGLNPHAGESGLMGDEEGRLIEPAIQVAVEHGMDVRGPFPADTVFNRAVGGEFDLVVAMYHDQGLIPVKLLDRDSSVNITMGLPIVRTSPDHGTAFDIAGRGVADAGSMIAAIDAAVRMCAGS